MAFDPSIISQIPDMAPNPVAAKANTFKLQDMMDTNTINKMKITDAKQQERDQETYKSILKGSDLSTDAGATRAAEKLTQAGLPDQAMKFMKDRQAIKGGALEIEQQKLAIAEFQQEAIVTTMDGVVRQVDAYKQSNPDATPAMLDAKVQELIVPAMGQLAQTRSDLAPAIDRYKQSPGALTYNGLIAAEAASKSGLARLKEHRDEQKGDRDDKRLDISQQQANTQAVNAATTAKREEAYEKNIESLVKNREPGLLSDTELALAVPSVMADGNQMKNFIGTGTSGKKQKSQINEAIAARMEAAGLKFEDLPRIRANTKAEATSIGKLIPQLNAVSAYEKLGKFNGEKLVQLVDQLDDTGIPLAEGPLRWAKNKVAGSDDAALFRNVLNAYQQEAARILNNPNMTGVLHRGAVEDMQHIISADVTASQAKELVNRINLEMDFRAKSLQEAINDAGAAMTMPGATPQPAVAPPGAPPGTSAGGPPGAVAPSPVAAPPDVPQFDPSQPGVGFWKKKN